MLRTRAIAGLVLDGLIVNDADAVTREYSQDLAVALALRNHSAKPDQRVCQNRLMSGTSKNVRIPAVPTAHR
jgi:hypothetical protein